MNIPKFVTVLIVSTLLTSCSGGTVNGAKSAGNCKIVGDIFQSKTEIAICLNTEKGLKYLIDGQDVETIKLLGNLIATAYIDYSVGQVGSDIRNRLNLDYGAGDGLNTAALKSYISGNQRWDTMAAQIVTLEDANLKLRDLYKYNCPKQYYYDEMCSPKYLSDSAWNDYLLIDKYWNLATEELDASIKVLVGDLEGKYKITDRSKIYEFYLLTL
jgi:hypothetical protein